ncbi:hypothetical protein [Paracoccus sp. S4493]|uniref:hypothetical protein n=1 Tax=Paracoccus sp. S4493 TaxID=579490 RepID=UPI000A58A6C4|nr:hypothetical protein [Paracoccus sp. S4493]
MKRAALLFCADVDASRFKLLKQRDQLPFLLHDQDQDSKWADYSLEDAFRLRIMLDLINDASKETYPGGLGPQFAQSVAGNIGVQSADVAGCRPMFWAGVIGFEGINRNDQPEHWLVPFTGTLGGLEEAVSQEQATWAEVYSEISVPRMFLANATRAAEYIRGRAAELGISEGDGLECTL